MLVLHHPPHLEPRHEIFRVERILHPEADHMPKRDYKIIAVLPAYNAESTLAATLADVPAGSVDEVLLVDDGSTAMTLWTRGGTSPSGWRMRSTWKISWRGASGAERSRVGGIGYFQRTGGRTTVNPTLRRRAGQNRHPAAPVA